MSNYGINNQTSSSSFIGPVYIKNAPKNYGKTDYMKASQLDYDNDGVVDYNTIVNGTGTVDFNSELHKDPESPYNKIDYYIKNNMTDLEIFQDIMDYNSSIGNALTPEQVTTIVNNVNVSIRDRKNNTAISTYKEPEHTKIYDVAVQNFMPNDPASNYSNEKNYDSRWKIDSMPVSDDIKAELRTYQDDINEARKTAKAIQNMLSDFNNFSKMAAEGVAGQKYTWTYNGVVLGTFVGGSFGIAEIINMRNEISEELNNQNSYVTSLESALLDLKKYYYRNEYVKISMTQGYIDYLSNLSDEEMEIYFHNKMYTFIKGYSGSLGYMTLEQIDIYNHMTSEEKKMFFYILDSAEGGLTAAKDYIFYIEELITERIALENIELRKSKFKVDENGKPITLNNLADEESNIYNLWCSITNNMVIDGYALGDGLDLMMQNMTSSLCPSGNRTVADWEKYYFLEYLTEVAPDLAKKYKIVEKIGEVAVPAAVSILVAVASENPALGSTVLSVFEGILTAGAKAHEVKSQGLSYLAAYTEGYVSGFAAFATTKLLSYFSMELLQLSETNLKWLINILNSSVSKSINKTWESRLESIFEGKIINIDEVSNDEIETFAKGLFIGCLAKGIGFTVKYTDGSELVVSKDMIETISKRYAENPNMQFGQIFAECMGDGATYTKDFWKILKGAIKA